MSKTVIYEAPQEGARPVAWWWAILQVVAMFIAAILVALVAAFIAAIAAVSIAALTGNWDPAASSEPPSWVVGAAVIAGMLGLFIGLALSAVVKVKIEKRSLASAGLSGFLYGPRFWGGFLGGAAIVALLIVPSGLAAMIFGLPEEMNAPMNVEHIMTGQFAMVIAAIFIFVLIQAPAEEIMFRGWLFSALGLRHGLITALIASSLLFTLLHADRAIAGFGWFVYTMVAVGSIGILFAAVAYYMRSVAPAAGLHTGYNFVSISLALAVVVMQADSPDVMTALMEIFDLGGMEPFEPTPATMVDMVARGAIPLAIAFWLFSRGRKRRQA